MTIDELKEPIENLLDKYKCDAVKITGWDHTDDDDLQIQLSNPQATRLINSERGYDEVREKLSDMYRFGDEDESLDIHLEANRIKSKNKIVPEINLKLAASRNWTDYEEDYDIEEFDIDEYEPEGDFQKKCPAYKDMSRADKVKMLGLEDVESHEIGTFSGSGDSGDYMPTGGTVGNTDFQDWMRNRVEGLMESYRPNFNNEGSYGHVNMSAKNGVITLDLVCQSGFRNEEQMEDMEAII